MNTYLKPYKEDCRYLQYATISNLPKIIAYGEFVVPDSCYIKETNHINAIDINICYNQLGYYLLYEMIENDLLKQYIDWDPTDFLRYQLSHVFITNLSMKFLKKITNKNFYGSICVDYVKKKKQNVIINTTFIFYENSSVRVKGRCEIIIENSLSKL